MSRRKRSNYNKGTLTYHENIFDTEDNQTLQAPWLQLMQYIVDIMITGFSILGALFSKVLAFFFAIILMIIITRFFSRYLYTTILDTFCPIVPSPLFGIVPACKHWNQPIPNFSQLAKVQENLCFSVLQQYPDKKLTLNPSGDGDIENDFFKDDDLTTPVSPLILKQVELATRDLQVMIKHSNLALADVLESKLGDYLVHSRAFGKDVQSMQSQTRGVIDNLITYNKITLRKLSDVEKGITSRQELKLIYEKFMELIEKEAKRLILAIEKAQGKLNILEEDLYSIHEITVREKSYQKSNQPHILADLGNLIRGKELQGPLVQENLQLLMEYDVERMKASRRLIILLDRMENVQMDLEELRTQIVTPLLIPDSLSLEIHIENINKAIDRLKQGKLVNFESTNPSKTGLPSSTLQPSTST